MMELAVMPIGRQAKMSLLPISDDASNASQTRGDTSLKTPNFTRHSL
jgi:hypothetical protein